MNSELLRSSFLTRAQPCHYICYPRTQIIYLIVTCQVVWHLSSVKTEVIHLRHIHIHVILQPLCTFHGRSLKVCASECHSLPALSWKHIIRSTCIFVFRLWRRNHYENDRTARKNDEFTAEEAHEFTEEATRQRSGETEESRREEKLASGLPASPAGCWEWFYRPFKMNICSLRNCVSLFQ